MIPYRNANLTAVTAPGAAADYDAPGGSGSDRWIGVLGVYFSEDLHEVESAAGVDEIIRTRVEIPYSPAGRLVRRGDTLTYTSLEDGTVRSRVARDVIYSPVVGRVRVLVEDK